MRTSIKKIVCYYQSLICRDETYSNGVPLLYFIDFIDVTQIAHFSIAEEFGVISPHRKNITTVFLLKSIHYATFYF
jgi:hypothetical protein